jgi:CRP/FNR family cyclic AMP-dependent transcriptional regulator
MPKIIEPILREIDFFKQCSEEDLKNILEVISKKTIRKRGTIFHEGEECNTIYFIAKGSVKILKTSEDGREHIVNILSSKDMFPHVGLFGGGYYPATARAIEDSTIYCLNIEDFKRILAVSPFLSIKLLQILDGKIRTLQERLGNTMSKDIMEKVVSTLHSLARTNGSQIDEGIEINMEITHQDIADMVGTTRESVSRIIGQLKRDGKIYYEENKIRLMD